LGDIPFITDEAIEKASRHLDTVVRGRDVDLRSPLGGAAPREQFLSEWGARLYPKIKDDPLLTAEEHANEKKDSPMSIMAPYAERKPSLMEYFTDPGGSIDDETLELACEAFVSATGIDRFFGHIRALSIEDACDRLPTGTSWGFPFLLRGVVVKDKQEKGIVTETSEDTTPEGIELVDNRPKYLELARACMADLDHPAWDIPCAYYCRVDLGDPEKLPATQGCKNRDVWGYPHHISILESMFFAPLTEAFKALPAFAAWVNLQATEKQVFVILNGSDEEHPTFGFDAKGFDKHVCRKLIIAVCDRIVIPCFQKGNEELIRRLSRYSRECGIVTPDGILRGRDFNRPSGSGGTNLLDCLENGVMRAAVLLKSGLSKEETVDVLHDMIVMGDDAVYRLISESENPTELYKELFGAIVNVDKETVSWKYTSFCKRLYPRGATHSTASTMRALMKAVSYERPPAQGWNSYVDSVRWIMQACPLESHPCFKEYVDFLCEKDDKYALGLKVPGGPLQLFKLASDQGRVNLDQILGLKAWSNEFTGFTTGDARNLPVVRYLLDKMRTARAES
jgi:hypothetical protein